MRGSDISVCTCIYATETYLTGIVYLTMFIGMRRRWLNLRRSLTSREMFQDTLSAKSQDVIEPCEWYSVIQVHDFGPFLKWTGVVHPWHICFETPKRKRPNYRQDKISWAFLHNVTVLASDDILSVRAPKRWLLLKSRWCEKIEAALTLTHTKNYKKLAVQPPAKSLCTSMYRSTLIYVGRYHSGCIEGEIAEVCM